MRLRTSGRPAHSRSSKAARSPGSAMAMTAANRSSSFIEWVLRLTQRNRRAKGAGEGEKIFGDSLLGRTLPPRHRIALEFPQFLPEPRELSRRGKSQDLDE